MVASLLLHPGSVTDVLLDMALSPTPRNTRGYVIGGAHHRAKLSDAQVDQVRLWRAEKVTCAEIARRLGVSIHLIKSISSGRHRQMRCK